MSVVFLRVIVILILIAFFTFFLLAIFFLFFFFQCISILTRLPLTPSVEKLQVSDFWKYIPIKGRPWLWHVLLIWLVSAVQLFFLLSFRPNWSLGFVIVVVRLLFSVLKFHVRESVAVFSSLVIVNLFQGFFYHLVRVSKIITVVVD